MSLSAIRTPDAPAVPKAVLMAARGSTEEAIRLAYASGYSDGYASGRQMQLGDQPTALPELTTVPILLVLDAVKAATGTQHISQKSGNGIWRRATYRARWAAAVLLREMCDCSTTHVARLLGYKDHTTIMYACNNYRNKPEVAILVDSIRASLQREEAA